MVYSCDSDEIEICQDGRLELEYTCVDSLEEMEERLLPILFDMLGGDPYVRPPAAARRINTLFLQCWANRLSEDEDSTYQMPEAFLKQLWYMVITLIEQIPHTHEAQRTMMKLILELQKIPEEEVRIASVSFQLHEEKYII